MASNLQALRVLASMQLGRRRRREKAVRIMISNLDDSVSGAVVLAIPIAQERSVDVAVLNLLKVRFCIASKAKRFDADVAGLNLCDTGVNYFIISYHIISYYIILYIIKVGLRRRGCAT